MKIRFERFVNDRLNKQLDYIAIDNKSAAIKLKENIKTAINNIKLMPYMCRKSIYFDNDSIGVDITKKFPTVSLFSFHFLISI